MPGVGGIAIAVISSPPNSPVMIPVCVPWATAHPLAPADRNDSVSVFTAESDVHEPGEPGAARLDLRIDWFRRSPSVNEVPKLLEFAR